MRGSGTGFSYEFCEISENTFFTENLWVTASNQKQSLETIPKLTKKLSKFNGASLYIVAYLKKIHNRKYFKGFSKHQLKPEFH